MAAASAGAAAEESVHHGHRARRQGEHVREDSLRYSRRGVGRDVRDRDATGTGGSEVDDVVAGGQHADVLELGQAADALGIQYGFVDKHDLGIGCPLGDQPGRGTVVGLHLAKRFEGSPVEVTGVGRVCIKDDYFHAARMKREPAAHGNSEKCGCHRRAGCGRLGHGSEN